MLNASWYTSNLTIHIDLCVPYVNKVIKGKINKYHEKIFLWVHSDKPSKGRSQEQKTEEEIATRSQVERLGTMSS